MLYIVSTPIGNLKDITYRAIEILKSVDFIICEDTRKASILLNHYEIKKDLLSFHKFSKDDQIEKIIKRLKSGDGALVTDAGTPGISDPGQYLIKKALENDIEIVSIPGPSAAIAALSISGFDTDKFLFLGFLPRKKGRQTLIDEISKFISLDKLGTSPIIFYESPFRVKKTLIELKDKIGDREIVVARELTKKFETIYRGKISKIIGQIKEKGEFVVIVK